MEPDPAWTPPTLPTEAREAVEAAIRFYEDALAPGDPLLIGGRVHTLLAQWRDREFDSATRDAISGDWLAIIGEYPLWAVHEAARSWLEWNERRPTIFNIRVLCAGAVREDQMTLRMLRRMS